MSIRMGVAIVLVTVAWGTAADAQTPSFQGLGDLPGGLINGGYESQVYGISADGSTAVGYSQSAAGYEAFVWTPGVGMVGLGDIDGGDFNSRANATSADGSVIVGRGRYGTTSCIEAFRWTSSTGMVGMGDLPWNPPIHSSANSVSADGSVIVGMGQTDVSSILSGHRAFRWTAADGMVDLGLLPGARPDYTIASATDVSADGSIVVGITSNAAGDDEGFIWTADDGMAGIGDLPGSYFLSHAAAISADGSTVVGRSESDNGREAFRWTAVDGMIGLGFSPTADGMYSYAAEVSADGSVIVGQYNSSPYGEAFVWDEAHGMRNLEDLLTDLGVDVTGWQLQLATGVSADGLTIVGQGYNPSGQPEAWIATVPEPATMALLGAGLISLAARRKRVKGR